jgi:hypothetical protein
VTVEDAGPLVATVRIDGPAPGARSLTRRFSLVAGSDQVFSEVAIDKTMVRTKESAHVAFPFNVPGGVVRADLGAALVEFERDQLPGSCRDFVGVHSAIDVSGPSVGVSLVSLDAPLIELGALTDERHNDRGTRNWPDRVAPGTSLFAYLLNNHWHTNYKADQAGPMTFRFVMRPHGAFDALALRRLSDEHDYPLLAVGSGGGTDRVQPPFTLAGDPVTVAWMAPNAGDAALIARLFNPSSVPATVIVRPLNTNMVVAGLTGTSGVADGRVTIPPRATRVIRLSGR